MHGQDGVNSREQTHVPKTAIIGATGFLGRNFLSPYRSLWPDCIATSRREAGENIQFLDLASPDISSLRLAETGHKEALILAGVTKVEMCEQNKEVTRKINVDGTLELIRQLVSEGIKPIFFSSDYVFDGSKAPYHDSDSTNPVTEYGKQKAEVERRICEIIPGNHLIIRLSKVFGLKKGDGTLFDEMAKILRSGGILRAAFDQVFCPTYVSDVLRAVLLLQSGKANGIVHVCPPEAWSRYNLAVALAKAMRIEAGKVCRISIDEISVSCKRPKNTSMTCSALLTGEGFSFTPIAACIDKAASNWRADEKE